MFSKKFLKENEHRIQYELDSQIPFGQAVDKPTIGEPVSSAWANNRYVGGIEGLVNKFRTSLTQLDWELATESPSCTNQ